MKTELYIALFMIVFIGCQKVDKKEYYVKPIEVVCDYPFNDTTKFAVTCRVWGLLKYYHPNVTAGKFDWDKVLLDRLDKISVAKTPEQVNSELMGMIRDAGKYKGTVDKNWNDSLNINVNLCWLDHSFINDSIRKELRKIASLTVIQPSYYVGNFDAGTYISGGLAFDNEKDYDMVSVLISQENRLLSLFRYWNVIYYFFPYKYMMDQSWDKTLEEFIPLFQKSDNLDKYQNAILQLAARINDGHAFTSISPEGGAGEIITDIDSITMVKRTPENSSLIKGDVILSINDQDIKKFRDSLATIISSSNPHFTNYAINSCIGRMTFDGCIMKVLRDHHVLTITEKERKISLPRSKKDDLPFSKISQDIGYVNMGLFGDSLITPMFDYMNNTKAIIFDLRNGVHPIDSRELFCHLVLSDSVYFYARPYFTDLSHIGSFYKYDKYYMFYSTEQSLKCNPYKGLVVTLISTSTMSSGETTAMRFRASGATLIGTPTAGANGSVAIIKLPGKISAYFSSLGFYYHDGSATQRKGVIPDIEVYPTMESILEERDEILDAAINFINNLKQPPM